MPQSEFLVSFSVMKVLTENTQRVSSLFDSVHLRLFDTQCIFIGQDWNAQNVQSSFWRFYFNTRDGAALALEDGLYPLHKEQIYFVPAGVRFSCRNAQSIQHFYVHFDLLGLPNVALRELFSRPVQVRASPALGHSTKQLAHDLRVLAQTQPLDIGWQCRIKSLLYEALWAYLSDTSPETQERLRQLTQSHAPVLPAMQHIEKNLSQPISNAELAQLCYLSEDYFIRRFRECVGQSPSQYIRERRVTMAAQQLLFSGASIDDIAAATGFGNRFYFSRVFTRQMGVSPAAYRKTSRV
jgi:AraC-like DNA-binding protein